MKKLTFLAVAVLLLLSVTTAFAGKPANSPNNGNSHEKATGEVWFSTRWGNVHIDFNAHETEPAKGWLRWERITGYTNWWAGPIVSTDVNGNEADFTVRVEEGALAVVGFDVTFHVINGGTPATSGDLIDITAVVNSPGESCAAAGQIQGPYSDGDFYDGNLVVHWSEPYLIETVTVYADNSNPTESSNILENGVDYLVKAYGTADAGANIEFDAKYSFRAGYSTEWTDLVAGYKSHGTELLDLYLNGANVDWGDYSENHTYEYELVGNGNPLSLKIYDIYYPNNTGNLYADIYVKLW